MSGSQINYAAVYPAASSGGGGGGGGITDGDLWDLALKEVDLTDGTWELFDPENIIDTVAFTGGRNVITVNALTSGSNARLNWKNSGSKRAPRWYKTAKIGTNDINREHVITGIYKLDFDSTREVSGDIICGLSKIPTSEVATGVNIGGAFGQISGQAYAAYGLYTFSGATFLSTGGPDQSLISFQHGGDRIGGGAGALLDSSNESLNSGLDRSSNQVHGDNGRPMSTVICFGLRQDNTPLTAGAQMKVSIKYLHIKADLS